MKGFIRAFALVAAGFLLAGEMSAQTQKIAARSHAGARIDWAAGNNFGLPCDAKRESSKREAERLRREKTFGEAKKADSLAQAHWQQAKACPAIDSSKMSKCPPQPKEEKSAQAPQKSKTQP